METPSYHDVVAYVNDTKYEVFNQPWSLLITCTRAAGWEMWENFNGEQTLIAGEYSHPNFRIEIKGFVICDSSLNNVDRE